MFTTEAVTGDLPVHIAAKILGHANLGTTQHYLAVFQDDMIRAYRSFLDHRCSVRPEAEYREPTEQEWTKFHQHFHERKLELGTCGRPYGTPANTNTPASDARCCALIPNIAIGSVKSSTVSANA
jgi:hypothetical protein